MSRSVNVANSYTTREIDAFLPISSGLGVSAWVSSLACSSINIVGDCTRCGGTLGAVVA
jgi:hypothetical protein